MEKEELIEKILSELSEKAIENFNIIVHSDTKNKISYNTGDFIFTNTAFYRTKQEINAAESFVINALMESLERIFRIYGFDVTSFPKQKNRLLYVTWDEVNLGRIFARRGNQEYVRLVESSLL